VQDQYTPQPEARGGVPANEDVDMAELLSAHPSGTRSVTAAVPGQLTYELVLSEKAIHHVRAIVTESLSMWGYDHLAFGVGLVVTELLTNSLRHTSSERARLVVQVLPALPVVGRLVVVVHDDDPGTGPRPRSGRQPQLRAGRARQRGGRRILAGDGGRRGHVVRCLTPVRRWARADGVRGRNS
jgi:hypothetical protein